MNIYIAHATSFDFKNQLYQPLKESQIFKDHTIVLPHETLLELFNSKEFFKNDCDLVIAEISYPSTGIGIELGWADMLNVDIISVFNEAKKPSSSAKSISKRVVSYSSENLVKVLDGLKI